MAQSLITFPPIAEAGHYQCQASADAQGTPPISFTVTALPSERPRCPGCGQPLPDWLIEAIRQS